MSVPTAWKDRGKMKDDQSLGQQYKESFRDLARHFLLRNIWKNWQFILNRLIIGAVVLLVGVFFEPAIGPDSFPQKTLYTLMIGSLYVDRQLARMKRNIYGKARDKLEFSAFERRFFEDYFTVTLSGYTVFLPTTILLAILYGGSFWIAAMFQFLIIEKMLYQKTVMQDLHEEGHDV